MPGIMCEFYHLKVIKGFYQIVDTDVREGLYVMTRGTRLGWLDVV